MSYELPVFLLDHVKSMEGLRLVPYTCPAGYLTVGYGHRTDSQAAITQTQAEEWLAADLATAQDAAFLSCPLLKRAEMSLPRRAALTDFCFNLGSAALWTSTLRRKVNVEDWVGAATENSHWIHAHQNGVIVELPGLIRRRAITSAWLLSG